MKEKNKKKYTPDTEEAENLLADVMEYYLQKSHDELLRLSKENIDGEIHLDKSSTYFYEIKINILNEGLELTGAIDGNGIFESDPLEIKYLIDKNNNIVG